MVGLPLGLFLGFLDVGMALRYPDWPSVRPLQSVLTAEIGRCAPRMAGVGPAQTITVLFSDLVQSTALAERLEAEALAELLSGCSARCA